MSEHMSAQSNGVASVLSPHTVDDTIELLTHLVEAKGAKIFAVIDHGGEAKAAGLTMRPTKLLVFGNPKAGTPIMVASPDAALDLPLKILVAQAADGRVWMSYNTPQYLQTRHNLSADSLGVLVAAEALAKAAGV